MSLLDYGLIDVPAIAHWLCVQGITSGVTSVGCGRGKLEALLVPLVGEVVGVDSSEKRLVSAARGVVKFETISQKRSFIEVNEGHVMLMVFPISIIPFGLYVDAYKGPRLVIIADDTCDPLPHAVIGGFVIVHNEVVPAHGRTVTMTVYDRL